MRKTLFLLTIIALFFVASVHFSLAQATGVPDSADPATSDPEPLKHPKLASALVELAQLYQSQGIAAVTEFNQLHPYLIANDQVLVEIRYDPAREADVETLVSSRGGTIRHNISDTFVEAWLPVAELYRLAEYDTVYLIQPARLAQPADTVGFIEAGASTTQGVSLMNADDWYALGLTGEGITIAIIDSFNSSAIAGLQASGDWPPGSQLTTVDVDGGGFGNAGSSHGMATMEIAYDMAPGATFIAYETTTVGDWYNALGLADAAGANITSASLSAPLDGIGDGTARPGSIAAAAGSARSGGVLAVNAAGIYRQQHWGGLFANSGSSYHNWGAGDTYNPFGPSGTTSYYCFPPGYYLLITLHWNDWINVNQDYDLYLYYLTSTPTPTWSPVASSTYLQNGGAGQTPQEAIGYTVPSNLTSPGCSTGYKSYAIRVQRFSGTTNNNLQVYNFSSDMQRTVEARSLGFPADSANVYSLGAIGVSSGTQEYFSSEGPILALGGGIPGSTTHNKPDAVSYSGVNTVSYPSGFSGTSASTPHVAGAAALLKQCDPTLTPAGLDSALDTLAAANDLGSSGYDFDYGFGNVILNTWTTVDRSDTPAYGEATHIRPNCPNATTEPGIYLGSTVTLDSVSLGQGGDDASDDGVVANDDWVNGGSGTVDVTVGGQAGYLWGWADLNCNGSFGDSGEQLFSALAVNEGLNAGLSFSVPAAFYTNCANQDIHARFRVSATSAGTRAASSPTGSATGGEVEDYAWPISTLPVTLASFESQVSGHQVTFNWSTTTELGNVGFYLYEETPAGRQQLNERLILSPVLNSTVPQQYTFTAATGTGKVFYLEDIDIRGHVHLHGPFELGQRYGEAITPQPIDWPAIQAEQDALAAPRQAAARNAARQALTPTLRPGTNGSIHVLVSQDGPYRITYADLVALGVDPAGQPTSYIALTNQGQPVPLTILGGSLIGPNTIIEFIGHGLDTLYSHTNVYTLQASRADARRIPRDTGPVPGTAPAPFYLATTTVEHQTTYNYLSPSGDPWYDTRMMAYGGPFARSFPLTVDHIAPGGPPPTLHLAVWGQTDWPAAGDDHRLQVSLNGTPLADLTFDGLVNVPLDLPLPAGLLQEGSNTLTLTVPRPVDPAIRWDIIMLDSYGVTYPRAFVAVAGALTFTAAGDSFEVSGLPVRKGTIYRLTDAGPQRLVRTITSSNGDGTFRVKFRGTPEPATYYVFTADAIPAPALAAAPPHTDITSGSADYLMIAHPSFIDGLAPLVQYHESRGLVVKVVNVEDVYAQFSHGLFDPQAIRDYVAHAVQQMGVQYVLLVGGDTYDYFNYLGLGSISFIPSLYAPTEPYVSFAPLDPLFADVDGDHVPDVPLGRFPVRTNAELANLIAKTLAYAAPAGQSMLMAADDGFARSSNNFLATLPAGWSITTAYLDDTPAATARQTIISSLNNGVRLTNFLGHSGPVSWTYDGLFSAADASALTNTIPTVVTQWGCWNTYHVDPAYNTLAHAFLLNPGGGAAAVLGASTLTQASSDAALGLRVLPQIVVPGQSLGWGVQVAKANLALFQPNLADVLLGWTLLGDPALVVQP